MKSEANTQADERNHLNAMICTACVCFCHDMKWSAKLGWQDEEKCSLPTDLNANKFKSDAIQPEINSISGEIQNALKFNYPIAFTGLENLSLESQKIALKMAQSLRAWVLAGAGETSADPWDMAFAQLGGWHASWSEIRLRSDAILLWYAPLWQTHPRWLERFGPRSRHAHKLAVLPPETSSAETGLIEEQIIHLDPGHAISFLTELRLALKQNEMDHADSRIRRLMHFFQNSKWAAIVRSNDPPGVQDLSSLAHCFNRFVIESNNSNHRIVVSNLPNAINAHGLHASISWLAGVPMPFWFSPEGPVFRPDEMKPDDFGLVIAFGPTSSEFKRARLIRFNSDADKTQSNGQLIEIPVAKPGNDSGGTVIRPDGIALQLHPLLKTTRMAVHEILNCIMDQLHAESAFRRFNS